ncbi:MAG: FG-GAP-like repeat-containing protein [Candidatus Latescibacterota bacterium]
MRKSIIYAAILIVCCTDGTFANEPPRIASGTIAFVKQIVYDKAMRTHAVSAADFDGDGDLDLASTSETNGTVHWHENDGTGGFVTHILDPNLVGAYPLHTGDVDSDGDPDLLSCGYFADMIVWYENDGFAAFTRHVVDSTADGPHSVVTGDMDDDDDIDLLASHQDYGNAVVWYENDGNQGFTLRMIDNAAIGAKRAEYADIDDDGDMDVIAGSYRAREVVWYENDGSENFTKYTIDQPADGAYFVYPVDIDGDNDLDVLAAICLEDQIALYWNDGSGNFTQQIIDSNAYRARSVAAADVDGDGDPDPISANHDENLSAWYENDGAGGFIKNIVDFDAYGSYGVTPIDIDFDGDIDVLNAIKLHHTVAVNYQIRSHHARLWDVGGTLVIDAAHLLTTDTDDGPADLTYTLTDAPVHGEIRKDGITVPLGGTFTQQDVNGGQVTYVHDGFESCFDRFDFSVADGGEDGVLPAQGTFTIDLPAVLSGYWPLDEGSGTVAGDSSGMGNNGTLLNGAVFEASTGDGSASAVRFDGVNDLIDLGNLDVNGTGFTLAVRFNAVSFPGSKHDPRLISKASSTQENGHVFMLGTFKWLREAVPTEDVRLRGRIRIGGVTRTVIASQGTIETDRWYHAAMTYDGTALRLYLDGIQVGGVTGLSGPVDSAPTVAVAIGGQPPGAGEHSFDGLIDDVRIVQRALTADEIMAIIDPITAVPEDIPETPGRRGLHVLLDRNKPNPFTPTTTILFELPRLMHVKLSVYTVTGELVSTIVNKDMAAGRKEVVWNARDGRGRLIASGIYFYRLVADGEVQTKKMVLLR